jgi:hypothetical protein
LARKGINKIKEEVNMAFKAGNLGKVALGTIAVVGMGNWKLNGITVDLLESTAFGDTAKQFLTGLLDYGSISFSGLYDPADTTGQTMLQSALSNNSKIANLRLYVDANSYWIANVTGVSASGVLIQSYSVGMDKSGLGTIDFTAKCTGPWILV